MEEEIEGGEMVGEEMEGEGEGMEFNEGQYYYQEGEEGEEGEEFINGGEEGEEYNEYQEGDEQEMMEENYEYNEQIVNDGNENDENVDNNNNQLLNSNQDGNIIQISDNDLNIEGNQKKFKKYQKFVKNAEYIDNEGNKVIETKTEEFIQVDNNQKENNENGEDEKK